MSEPVLCVAGCGFFGSTATEMFCSKCYRLLHKDNNKENVPSSNAPTTSAKKVEDEPSKEEVAAAATAAETASPNMEQKEDPAAGSTKKPRCLTCRKRLGLTGFECRCGGRFCAEHRYSTAHDCSFDFKAAEREELRRALPTIAAEKIRKI